MARLILVFMLLALVACATRPGPVVVTETEREPEAPPAAVIQPQVTSKASVAAYSRSATEALGREDYPRAISLAERGLRSNRYAADLYLILARAYSALGNPEQARNFARLGLRYSGADESLSAQLQALAQP